MDRIRLRNKCTHKIRIDNVFARSEYLLLRNSTAGEIRLRYDPSGFAFFKLQNRVLRSTAAKNRTRDPNAAEGSSGCISTVRAPILRPNSMSLPLSPTSMVFEKSMSGKSLRACRAYRYSASGSGCLRSGRHSSKRRRSGLRRRRPLRSFSGGSSAGPLRSSLLSRRRADW